MTNSEQAGRRDCPISNGPPSLAPGLHRLLVVRDRGPPATLRIGILAAAGVIAGIVLSGPLAVALVAVSHPQPPWAGPDLFVESFHPVQTIPYLGGIVLVGGVVLLIAAIHAAASPEHRALSGAALIFSAVFAALIFLNYVLQSTYLPTLVRERNPASGPLISALAMANPRSLAWAIEMWGWGFAGAATWLVAPVFRGSRRERAASAALTANGIASIASAAWTVYDPGWVLTPLGIAAGVFWNALFLAAALLVLLALRGRLRGAATAGR